MHKYHGDFQKLSVTVKHSKSQVLSSWGSRDILPYNWTPALIEAPTSKMTKSCCCSIFPSASSSWFSGLFELSILDCLVPRKKLRWIYFFSETSTCAKLVLLSSIFEKHLKWIHWIRSNINTFRYSFNEKFLSKIKTLQTDLFWLTLNELNRVHWK